MAGTTLVFDETDPIRESPEGGWEIPDPSDATEDLRVDPAAPVRVIEAACCDPDEPIAYDAFRAGFPDVAFRDDAASYWLTIEDGVVVAIEEQYLP